MNAEILAEATLPRERALSLGVSTLQDDELWALVLGSGTAGVSLPTTARAVSKWVDQGRDVSKLPPVPGLGPAKQARVVATLELGRRVFVPRGTRIHCAADLFPTIRHLASRTQEIFVSVALNGAHEILTKQVVTVGLVNRTVVHPREVFAPAIEARAAAIVVAHNHPSGHLEPSPVMWRSSGSEVPEAPGVSFTCR